jgi:hypothetical protein
MYPWVDQWETVKQAQEEPSWANRWTTFENTNRGLRGTGWSLTGTLEPWNYLRMANVGSNRSLAKGGVDTSGRGVGNPRHHLCLATIRGAFNLWFFFCFFSSFLVPLSSLLLLLLLPPHLLLPVSFVACCPSNPCVVRRSHVCTRVTNTRAW